ncbi:hypothetical protein AFK24_23555 [Pseudomonas syringae]|uniref:Lipoprotein n=1 Tax=Pseudomonas syringae TaxID=317 RepID=A0A1C7Z103_PSESX|nr:hypothetical protein [Pseudomonas syringae]OCR22746.1 hypothetical protein AFK24_23555 [Pseudomonas syringae]
MSIQIRKSHRFLLLAAIAASLPGCTISAASQHDYSGLPDDPFAEVVRQVRGGSRDLFNNIERGQIISQQFLRGKNLEQIRALFTAAQGVCVTGTDASQLVCVVDRWWKYAMSRSAADSRNRCLPGIQLRYRFSFDEPSQLAATWSRYDFDVIHLAHCNRTRTIPG